VRLEALRLQTGIVCRRASFADGHRLQTGISGYAAKADVVAGIIYEALRLYLRQPSTTLNATA